MALHLKILAFISVVFTGLVLFISFNGNRLIKRGFQLQEDESERARSALVLKLLKAEVAMFHQELQALQPRSLEATRKILEHDSSELSPGRWTREGAIILVNGTPHSAAQSMKRTGTGATSELYVFQRKLDLETLLKNSGCEGTIHHQRSEDEKSERVSIEWLDISDLGTGSPLYLRLLSSRNTAAQNNANVTRFYRIVLVAGVIAIAAFMFFFHHALQSRITRLHERLRLFRLGKIRDLEVEPGTDELCLLGGEVNDLLKRNKILAEDLSFSEECYKTFVSEHTGLVCRFSRDGQLTYVSESYARYYSSPRDELLGQHVAHALTPGSRTQIEEYLQTEPIPNVHDFECQAVNADGKLCRQQWRWHAIFDDEYELIEYQGIGRDITEQWQAQTELAHQRELERLLLAISTKLINLPADDVDEGISYVLQHIGEFTQADTGFTCFYNADTKVMRKICVWRSKPDFVASAVDEELQLEQLPWIHSRLSRNEIIRVSRLDDLPRQASNEHAMLERNGVKSFMVVPMYRDRSLVGLMSFETHAREQVWDKEIETLLTVAAEMVVNAIERRNAMRRLEEGQQRLRRILGAVQTGIFVVRLRGRKIIDVNDQACEMVGIPRDELINSLCMRVFDSLPAMPGAPREGLCWNAEDQLKTKNSSRLPVLRTSVTIMMDGELHLIESVVDLTNQKKLENERMQNERLQGVLEMAGAACHELNQPLQVITGYAELLMMKTAEDDSNYSKMKLLREQATKLAQITQKINNITTYETQDYLSGKIIDINKSGSDDAEAFALPADKVNMLLAQVVNRKRSPDETSTN